MLPMSELGSRLRLARGRVTQQAVAAACGCSKESVSQWESGATKPSLDNLVSAAAFLGVRVDWVLFGRPPRDVGGYIESEEVMSSVIEAVMRSISSRGREPTAPDVMARIIMTIYRHILANPDGAGWRDRLEALMDFVDQPRQS